MPLFNIPAPPAYTMSNAPLAQALAQVRYPLIADFESMQGIAPLQRELHGTFPYMQQEKVQELSFVAGPAGPATNAAESVNWQFTDDAGSLVVIGAGSATLSIGDFYTGVEDFAEMFTTLLDALAAVRVSRCDRLGVRYLSIAADSPTEPQSWRNWFKSQLVGWPGSDIVGSKSTLASVSQSQLSVAPEGLPVTLPGNLQAAVRHGAVPAGTGVPGVPPLAIEAPSYFLDVDVFTEGHQQFLSNQIIEQFHLFHSEINKFFFWSVTEEGGKHFGLSVDGD
jgi:uncharacterized protein (TIGR04255 family)